MTTNTSKTKVMLLSFLALCLGFVSCYDDSGLMEKIKEIENRVSKLEEECKAMNTNISSLQTIVTALQQNDYVTSVAPITKDGIEIGYTFSFDKSDPITIYHGKEGNTPVIGIKKHTDNNYYWTIDGEWLLNAEGNMVAVSGGDGITPKLKIEDDYWYVSYDNGNNWTMLYEAVSEDGDSFFESVTQDDKYVYLTLSDGTIVTLPKNSSFIQFEDINVKAVCMNWDTNFDGELSYEEAAQVESLGDKFNGTTIGIFKELKYFTKLTSLDAAFKECTQLVYVDIPSNVTSLGSSTFYGCKSLRCITIPKSEICIGNSVFSGCRSLTSITLPEGVTSIGDYAFKDCSSLTNINIPEGVTSIGERAFSGCTSLTNINIPEGVTSIGTQAFKACSSLTSVTIPESVTRIGQEAFADCTCLTSVTIPESVTSIGVLAFSGCMFTFDNFINNSACISSDNWGANLFEKEVQGMFINNDTIVDARIHIISATIPEGVTSIGERAFYGCSSLTSITLPESVTSIGDFAFYGCSSLTSITLPEGVTSIGKNAFYGCSSLTSITIPENSQLMSIGDYAFYGCRSLTSITLPEGVTSIGKSAFYGCISLKSIKVLATTPPTAANDFFRVSMGTFVATLYVPEEAVSTYQNTEPWSYFETIIGF